MSKPFTPLEFKFGCPHPDNTFPDNDRIVALIHGGGDFGPIRYEYEQRIESILIEIGSITRPDGIPIYPSSTERVLIDDFNMIMNDIEKGYNSTEIVMIPAPGGGDNDD